MYYSGEIFHRRTAAFDLRHPHRHILTVVAQELFLFNKEKALNSFIKSRLFASEASYQFYSINQSKNKSKWIKNEVQ